MLASCVIATGLSTLAATTRAAALTHIPNLNATDVRTGDSTKAKKEDKRGHIKQDASLLQEFLQKKRSPQGIGQGYGQVKAGRYQAGYNCGVVCDSL